MVVDGHHNDKWNRRFGPKCYSSRVIFPKGLSKPQVPLSKVMFQESSDFNVVRYNRFSTTVTISCQSHIPPCPKSPQADVSTCGRNTSILPLRPHSSSKTRIRFAVIGVSPHWAVHGCATIMRALFEFIEWISHARITFVRRLSQKPPEILANVFAVNGATMRRWDQRRSSICHISKSPDPDLDPVRLLTKVIEYTILSFHPLNSTTFLLNLNDSIKLAS